MAEAGCDSRDLSGIRVAGRGRLHLFAPGCQERPLRCGSVSALQWTNGRQLPGSRLLPRLGTPSLQGSHCRSWKAWPRPATSFLACPLAALQTLCCCPAGGWSGGVLVACGLCSDATTRAGSPPSYVPCSPLSSLCLLSERATGELPPTLQGPLLLPT